jgi:hypothetical protein
MALFDGLSFSQQSYVEKNMAKLRETKLKMFMQQNP